MVKNKHGYTPAAMMFNNVINELRDYIEYEKFLCRTITDNETTQEFKKRTQEHRKSKYRFKYNNKLVNEHTAAGKKEVIDATTEKHSK